MKQYQFVKQLGSGSFGRVIKVKKLGNSNDYYAIKQIKMTALSEKQKDCALNEIRLLASINSPNVIAYHTAFFDETTNNLCIVMEFADGGDLANMIAKKREKGQKFNENFIWQVAYDLLKALKILHGSKIIHRDLKPGNIFFVDGVAKLGDMNISKVMEGNFACTQAGTPYYISPQIWNGDLYDGKCDIWSLGCLLYEIATLRPPFTANDIPTLSKKVTAGYFDPIPALYSKKLSDSIRSCLRVRMFERPAAHQLLQDSVFKFIQTNQEGTINLLNTIRCPRVLKMIQNKLPDAKSLSKVEVSRKREENISYLPPEIKKFTSEQKYKLENFNPIPLPNGLEKQNEYIRQRSKKSLKGESAPLPSRGILYRIENPINGNPRPVGNSPVFYRRIM